MASKVLWSVKGVWVKGRYYPKKQKRGVAIFKTRSSAIGFVRHLKSVYGTKTKWKITTYR